ncbi:MAG: hypothetical protein KDG55_04830 [Rhodocyclaceae bacterium]|nr:hypothetical protein [Rhodocyclaceae bacterium]
MHNTVRTVALATALGLAPCAASFAATSVLFVGNSYTFGRVDPVMSYNTAGVRDLTEAMWLADDTGSNLFEPHPWGGVPGIFKRFTEQAGLDYDVALSTRNAASLRGHFLNLNPAGWDLRSNIGSQVWDQVVLQEQSDEALPKQPGLASNPAYFNAYANLIVDFIHVGEPYSFRERDFFAGATTAERTAACVAETGSSSVTCNRSRDVPANPNASPETEIYLYQTWARPNLVNAPFTTETDEVTGEIRFTDTPATSFYPSLFAMTLDLHDAYFGLAAANPGIAGVAPVGDAFLQAVVAGVATADMYADDALTDHRLDLWFDDGTHASKYGSYLSALVIFGTLTGLDPRDLGPQELAAQELGIAVRDVVALQQVASSMLGFGAQPNPQAGEPAGKGPGWRGGQH